MQIKINVLLYLIISLFIISCGGKTENTKSNSKKQKTEQIQEVNTVEETDYVKPNNTSKDANSLSFSKILLIVLGSIAIGGGVILFFYSFVPLRLWYEAWLSGVRVSWHRLIMMRWQRVPQVKILELLIKAQNAGLKLSAAELVNHYLANVDIDTVVNTLIRAKNASLPIPLNELAAQFLARVDVEKVINALVSAKNAQIDITLSDLSSYYLANVDVEKLIKAKITALNSGFVVSIEELKEHCLAGGNLEKTVTAYVAAKKAHLPDFDFHDIASIDLAGIDVTRAINTAITPKVIETGGVTGIARDGVQLTMKVKITLRGQIKGIIGGAGEDTVLARVNESLGSEIGSSESHRKILESPYELAERIEAKNLGNGSSYEILSIDVSDIQIGKDVRSELMIARARAEAEIARTEVIKAEEKKQQAMAAAFLDGKLTVKDYNNLMNTEADTKMRESLAKKEESYNLDVTQHNLHK